MIADLVPWMQGRAVSLDRDAAFPAEEIARLRERGALAPLAPGALTEALVLAGQGNLSVGRIFEAHVNALHLVARYGGTLFDGALYALWVTDPPTGGLAMRRDGERIVLTGGKQFCSGAGYADAALVTATDENGDVRMLTVRLGTGEKIAPLPSPLSGMRAAVTGAVDFTGCEVPASAVLGGPGDYLREPDFSAGAWRGSAVACGGLIALVAHSVKQLAASGRLDSPHAQARVGRALIARDTARLWVDRAARADGEPGHVVATVGLARIAVEAVCLDAVTLLQRSLGLSAFRQGSPVELICRDLATYLRQPAPDEVLTESARWFADECLGQ